MYQSKFRKKLKVVKFGGGRDDIEVHGRKGAVGDLRDEVTVSGAPENSSQSRRGA